jgi:acyl-CoA reductase-like NAD-dependent aldehyde dehydrogenase
MSNLNGQTAGGIVILIEGPYLCYTERVPLGVRALMTSFSHPLMILSKSLAPALATGNSVVIKASEQMPLTARAARRTGCRRPVSRTAW